MNLFAIEHPETTEMECEVVSIEMAAGKNKLAIVTNQSPFQTSSRDDDDKGVIIFDNGKLHVGRVSARDNSKIAHVGRVVGKAPEIGSKVRAEVDIQRRRTLMASHAACHVIYGCGQHIVGENFAARSKTGLSDFYSEWIGQEFLTDEVVHESIRIGNELIQQGVQIEQKFVTRENALSICGSTTLDLLPKEVETVRLVTIGHLHPDPCAGLHSHDLNIIPGEIVLKEIKRKDENLRVVMSLSAELN